MSEPASQPMLSFVPDALSASQVGVWETDFAKDRTRGDATLAALFGVDPLQAAEGLPLAHYVRNVVAEDRAMLYDKLNDVREVGGLFVIEYRTRPSPNTVRWVLARGRYERSEGTGAMTGRGIVIDITESKLDGQMEDRALFFAPNENVPSLDQVAVLALQARQEIDELGEQEGSPLRRAVDAFLMAVGRAIAQGQTAMQRVSRKVN